VSQPDEEILSPFNILRRLKHVHITGVSERFAHRMSNLMKSDEPVVDLPKMYRNVDRFARAYGREGRFPKDELERVELAMDSSDADAFYKARDLLMCEIKKSLDKAHDRVFKYDPDPVSARSASHKSLVDRENVAKTLRG